MSVVSQLAVARFNVRAYGVWINHLNQVLVTEETHLGRRICKFPGGGLDFGEGLLDCLRREWAEELGITPAIIRHYYTTDFFQPSAFQPDEQVISIYYLVEADVQIASFQAIDPHIQLRWIPLSQLEPEMLTLSIDQYVAELLKRDFGTMPNSAEAN